MFLQGNSVSKPFYINPAFKSSIFNTSMDTENSQVYDRTSRLDISRNQENPYWKQNLGARSITEDPYYREKSWDRREKSVDDSKCFSSTNQSFGAPNAQVISEYNFLYSKKAGKSFQEGTDRKRRCSGQRQERIRSGNNKSQGNMAGNTPDWKPLSDRKDYNNTELELAIFERNQFIQERNRYKRELDKQVNEKNKRQKINEILDLTYTNSGLPIGEIDAGFDVHDCAKLMKIKANKKARCRSQDLINNPDAEKILSRSITSSRDYKYLEQIYGGHNFNGSSMGYYNDRQALAKSFIEKVEEEEYEPKPSPKSYVGRSQERRSVFGGEQDQNRQAKDLSVLAIDQSKSKYHLKRVCHAKLRDALRSQLKKCEDYTAKLLEDSKKRKQAQLEDIENQIARNRQKKTALVYKEKQEEKMHREMQIGELRHKETAKQKKEAQLAIKPLSRPVREDKPTKTKIVSAQEQRDGVYQKLMTDTVNQLLQKRAKIIEQAHRRTSSTIEKRGSGCK